MNARCIALAFVLLAACSQPHPFSDAGTVDDLVADANVTPPGAACAVDPSTGEVISGCSGGQFCLTPRDGFPGGYCAPDCRATPCPASAECYPLSATRHYCVLLCTRDSDCRVADGYACRAPNPGAHPACLPNDQPLGRRADGGACFVSSADDAGAGGTYLAPLPSVAFTEPSLSVSQARIMTVAESDPSIAADPTRGGAVVAFSGLRPDSWFNGGLTRVPPTGPPLTSVVVTDHDFPSVVEPTLAFDRAGAMHAVYLADNPDRPFTSPIRWSRSDDGGATLPRALSVFPSPMDCNDGCFAPGMALGPAVRSGDAIYVAALADRPTGAIDVIFTQSLDVATPTFATTQVLATREVATNGDTRTPDLVAVGAGPAPGAVAVVWIAINTDDGLAQLGSAVNRVRLRTSSDGGQTFGAFTEVARAGDAPVSEIPWVASGGGWLHVAYVNGGLTGAWDVVLASSHDGGATFAWRVVDDDPERCATHAFAGLAVDPASGDAHVLFLDNRYGPGEAVYARCPADPSTRCSRNERVPGDPFVFTTSRDATLWQGTHSSLALGADGSLWAAWSDSRTGGAAVYAARGHVGE